MSIQIGDTPARLAYLCSHPKMGHWFAIGGRRGAVEVRVTNSGMVRVIREVDAKTARIWLFPDEDPAP